MTPPAKISACLRPMAGATKNLPGLNRAAEACTDLCAPCHEEIVEPGVCGIDLCRLPKGFDIGFRKNGERRAQGGLERTEGNGDETWPDDLRAGRGVHDGRRSRQPRRGARAQSEVERLLD